MSMQNEQQDDEARAEAAAFRAFMLGGGKKNASPLHHGSVPPSCRSPKLATCRYSPNHASKSPEPPSSQSSKVRQLAARKYHGIAKAFRFTLRRDWLEVDDNLGQVIQSIAHLRDRCWVTSRCLVTGGGSAPPGGEVVVGGGRSLSWKEHGYRSTSRIIIRPTTTRSETSAGGGFSALTRDDLERALTRDLLQHERMLSGARRLTQGLGQAQEALGRRLDELMSHHLETLGRRESTAPAAAAASKEDNEEVMVHKVEECQQIYAATAAELYRKQVMVQRILDSVRDGLLYTEADQNNPNEGLPSYQSDSDPRLTARRVSDQWHWTNKESHLHKHQEILRKILQQDGS